MSTINNLYFIGERGIPNINAADVSSTVSYLITKYEEEYLINALGYELFKLYSTGIQVLPTPDTRYTQIFSGAEFTDQSGQLCKWNGLQSVPNSPIADYVYYQWLLGQASQTTGIGQAQATAANSVLVTPQEKMCKFWNKQAESTKVLVAFLNANISTYPEFVKHSSGIQLGMLVTRLNPFFN